MKRLLAILLAALMLASFAACSGDEETEENLHDYLQVEEIVDQVTIGSDTFYIQPIDTETIAITGYKGSDALHAVTIPAEMENRKVVTIDEYAFRNCTAITAVTLPATLEKIAQYSFAGCLALESVTIPKAVTTLAEGAFVGCTSLKTVTFEEGSALTGIAKNAFNGCVALEAIAAPATVKAVGAGAFYGCTALETVTFAEGLETLGAQAFHGCAALNTLTVPASLVNFETSYVDGWDRHMVFAGCEALYLDGITVPAGSVAETYFTTTIALAQSAPAVAE